MVDHERGTDLGETAVVDTWHRRDNRQLSSDEPVLEILPKPLHLHRGYARIFVVEVALGTPFLIDGSAREGRD